MTIHGEVIGINYKDDKKQNLYSIKCKLLSQKSNISSDYITARPIDINKLKLPIQGEIVKLIQCISPYASANKQSTEWYFTDIINVQSSVHHNALPLLVKVTPDKNSQSNLSEYQQTTAGTSTVNDNDELGDTFEENSLVAPIQHFEGDYVIEGRHGTGIRFGSTIDKGLTQYTKKPTWKKGKGQNGDPIIIVTAGYDFKDQNSYYVEDINNDSVSIFLTSGQSVPLTLSSKKFDAASQEQLTTYNDDNTAGNQLLVSTDRIILNSRTKEIVLASGGGISLTSPKSVTVDSGANFVVHADTKILFGPKATEPLLLGNKTGDWLDSFVSTVDGIVDAIMQLTVPTPVGPSGVPINLPIFAQIKAVELVELKAQIESLKSKKSFTI